MNNDIKNKLIKARIGLLTAHPFWGTLALRLVLREMPADMKANFPFQPPTLAVDGKNIFFNPEFVQELTLDDTKTVIAHEVSHCVFEHLGRRGERDPDTWNEAGDYAINPILKNAGLDFTHKSGWLLDPQFFGMSADQIYNLLPKQPKGGGGQGPGKNPMCNVMDGEAKKDITLQDDWKMATASAAMLARQQGKLPADLERFVDELMNPKTDWRAQLRRFVTETAKDDYSWARPKKMMIPHGFYVPTLYSERMGTLVVKIDTSGSITQHMLNIFGSEIQGVREQVRPEKIIVIYCDARVNHVDEFDADDVLELKMHGGGGTDFRPPFEYLEEKGIVPICSLYFTDGYGTFPSDPAPYPVLWCMTTNVQPPWGEVVEIDMTAELETA